MSSIFSGILGFQKMKQFSNCEAIAFSTCFSVDLGNMLQIMANQRMLAHMFPVRSIQPMVNWWFGSCWFG